MKQYIDKAAIIAEIERKIHNIDYEGLSDRNIGQKQSLYHIFSFLDTLEVKEMDFEKELSYEDYIGFFKEHPNFPDDWGFDEAWVFAKHFFELGLKAKIGG